MTATLVHPMQVADPSPMPQDIASAFLSAVAQASQSALLLDFDGTLAPFRVDPAKAHPWAGVRQLLNQIQAIRRTRIVVISGRPAANVAEQLALAHPIEVWGLHGSEWLNAEGHMEVQRLPAEQSQWLSDARRAIDQAHLGCRLEQKSNAVVVHWRGKSQGIIETAAKEALTILRPFAANPGLALLQFNGGIELRAGRNKGDAVHQILKTMSAQAPVAYLGDDITDEDAFQALASRSSSASSLSILVRRTPRKSVAQLHLRPPSELRTFLRNWLRAIQRQ